MSENQRSGRRGHRQASFAAFAFGGLLLALVPLIYLVLAVAGAQGVEVPGTLVIISSTLGMILIVAGAALAEF